MLEALHLYPARILNVCGTCFAIALACSYAGAQPVHQPCTGNDRRAGAAQMLQHGQGAEAAVVLSQLHAECPSDGDTTRLLIEADLQTGSYAEAKQLAGLELKRQNSAGLHVVLGKIAGFEKQYRTAAADFQAAAQLEPTEEILFLYGTSLTKLDFEAATKIERYALGRYPSSVRLHVALAVALYGQGATEEAARHLCEAASLDPTDPQPMKVLAQTEILPESSRAEAVRHLADLHQRYPKDGELLFDYAMANAGRWSGEKGKAPPDLVSQIKAALAMDPALDRADAELGSVYDEDGHYAEAIAVLQRAIVLQPEKPEYHYRLAFTYRKAGNQPAYEGELRSYAEIRARRSTEK